LETTSGNYVLSINLQWIGDNKITFDGDEYLEGDEVEITGTVTIWQGMEEYHNLEIETIKKVEPPIIYTGKLIVDGNPCPPPDPENPCVPGAVLWLETTSLDYVLTINSYWIWTDYIIFGGIEYFEDDEVEITGIVTEFIGVYTEDVYELEIETIKKVGTGIGSPSKSESNKVYYDATNRVIVIDKTLQNQFSTLELYDMQGKVILRKTDTGNTISIANLPSGVYLYRLLENNRAIYSGKILK
jgi:hypothetical protein